MKPEIGKEYHFWDDGKVSPSRHYICKVIDIISLEQAKDIMLEFTQFDCWHGYFDPPFEEVIKMSLYDIWMYQKESCDWLFADETPYFVKISIPTYDDNDLYCVQMKNGGWFSLDIQSGWQGGVLDIDGEIWDNVMKDCVEPIENEEERENFRKLYTSAIYLKR
jgi:hypothetical protein